MKKIFILGSILLTMHSSLHAGFWSLFFGDDDYETTEADKLREEANRKVKQGLISRDEYARIIQSIQNAQNLHTSYDYEEEEKELRRAKKMVDSEYTEEDRKNTLGEWARRPSRTDTSWRRGHR